MRTYDSYNWQQLNYMLNICYLFFLILPAIFWHFPEDDQSILIEKLSCNHQFFSELIPTQFENFTWCHRK